MGGVPLASGWFGDERGRCNDLIERTRLSADVGNGETRGQRQAVFTGYHYTL